jgi:DivIVA domain-containing protein
VASGTPLEHRDSESALAPAAREQGGDATEDRSLVSEIREVSFPVSVRGYDRAAVDAYVERVQQVVAELEVTRTPEAAVKHALAQVGEHTKGMLERAGETVEQITVTARAEAKARTARASGEADEIVARAKAEAAELRAQSNTEAEATVAQARKEAAEELQRSQAKVAALRNEAEARLRELAADTESIRQERNRLLDEIRAIAARVERAASAADARFPRPEPAQPPPAVLESQAVGEGDPTADTATHEPPAERGTPRDSPE